MTNEMDSFRDAFFEEAAEHLANMESALLELEGSPRDPVLLNTIFRAAHTIKGTGAMVGLDEVSRFTHSLENLLDRMRAGTLDSSPERLDLLLRSTDLLRGLLDSSKAGREPPPAMEDVLAELKEALGQKAKAVALDTDPACLPSQVSPQPVAADRQRLSETSASRLCEPPESPLVAPLAKAHDLLRLAIDLVRAQASLIRTARDFAACFRTQRTPTRNL
jgi:chemotaxis protein histidine kinase CheA